MSPSRKIVCGVLLAAVMTHTLSIAAAASFICKEPGGKRLVEVDGNNISLASDTGKTLLYIDGNDILTNPHDKAFLVVDENDIRHTAAGVKIATFDGDNIRHGPSAEGKVMINYKHPDLCPTASDNRIYSIEGDALTRQQLVAGLYLLKPEMFKLSEKEVAQQQKEIKEAGEEEDKKAAADQVAGSWMVLNSSGINDKVGQGSIVVSPKKGEAYPVSFDFTKGGGPVWTGVGAYQVLNGDKLFFAAYGTAKMALGVYQIDGGSLKGIWYPYYVDGTDKTLGTENLKGPETLNGTYTIESAKAPFTGASYSGTVTIVPEKLTGTSDDAQPYLITWTFDKVKVYGIGIRTGKQLFVSAGAGPEVNIAKFKITNGSMTSEWFKLGATEMGNAAATSSN